MGNKFALFRTLLLAFSLFAYGGSGAIGHAEAAAFTFGGDSVGWSINVLDANGVPIRDRSFATADRQVVSAVVTSGFEKDHEVGILIFTNGIQQLFAIEGEDDRV